MNFIRFCWKIYKIPFNLKIIGISVLIWFFDLMLFFHFKFWLSNLCSFFIWFFFHLLFFTSNYGCLIYVSFRFDSSFFCSFFTSNYGCLIYVPFRFDSSHSLVVFEFSTSNYGCQILSRNSDKTKVQYNNQETNIYWNDLAIIKPESWSKKFLEVCKFILILLWSLVSPRVFRLEFWSSLYY